MEDHFMTALMRILPDLEGAEDVKALFHRIANVAAEQRLVNDDSECYTVAAVAAMLVHGRPEKAKEILEGSTDNPKEMALVSVALLREVGMIEDVMGERTLKPIEDAVNGSDGFEGALARVSRVLADGGEVKRQPGPDMAYIKSMEGDIRNSYLSRTTGYTLNTAPSDYADFVEESVHGFAYARHNPSHQWRIRLSITPHVTNPLSPPSIMNTLELVDELQDREAVVRELGVSDGTFERYYKTLVRYLFVHPDPDVCKPTKLGKRVLDDEEKLAEAVLRRGFWAIISKHPKGGSVAERLAKKSVVNRNMKWKDEVDISTLVDAATDHERAEREIPLLLAIHGDRLSTAHLAARAGVSTNVAAQVLEEHLPGPDWKEERLGV